MNENENFALVPKAPGALEKAGPGTRRVLSGMVTDALVLIKKRWRPKPRIVLVNDDAELLQLVESIIGDEFTVSKFQNGEQAWQELQRRDPDILVTDMRRPDDAMDGWTMIPLLAKKKVKYPIIVASGCHENAAKHDDKTGKPVSVTFREFLEQARQTLNITALTIPFQIEELLRVLETCLQTRSTNTEWSREMEFDSQEPYGPLKAPCPKCGGEVREKHFRFECQKCDFALRKIMAGRQLEIAEVEQLFEKGQVGPLQGFRSAKGFPLAATIRMKPDFTPEFNLEDGAQASDQTVSREFELKWRFGARTAHLIVTVASKFASRILILRGHEAADAKSFMDLCSVSADTSKIVGSQMPDFRSDETTDIGCGDLVRISVEGSDSAEAMEALTALFTCGSRVERCLEPTCSSKPTLIGYTKDSISYCCKKGHGWEVPRLEKS